MAVTPFTNEVTLNPHTPSISVRALNFIKEDFPTDKFPGGSDTTEKIMDVFMFVLWRV